MTQEPCREIDPSSIQAKIEPAERQLTALRESEARFKEEKKRLAKFGKEANKTEAKTDHLKELEESAEGLRLEMTKIGARDVKGELETLLDDWEISVNALEIKFDLPIRGENGVTGYLLEFWPLFSLAAGENGARVNAQRRDLEGRIGELRSAKKGHEVELERLRLVVQQADKDLAKNHETKQKMEEKIKRIAFLNTELGKLEVMVAALEQSRAVANANFEKNRIYESNRMVAAKADGLTTERETLLQKQGQINLDIESLTQQKTALESALPAEAAEETQMKLAAAIERIGALKTEIQSISEVQTELKLLLETMESALRAKLEKEAAMASLQSMKETSAVIREVLNKAGPLVAQRYREVISERANAIFRTINEERADLVWRKDYLLTLHDMRGDREFNQLSGGEQMTAALSIQLALAKEFSDLGVAMFDEPTTNMDKERRGELAKIIGRIKETYGFEQLFVISHDESFETMTEQVIRLEKVDGATKLAYEL